MNGIDYSLVETLNMSTHRMSKAVSRYYKQLVMVITRQT